MSEVRELSVTEKKIYLIFSLIFEKIMDEYGYQRGTYEWNMIRPKLFSQIGLDDDIWTDMSDLGDADDKLQDELGEMREKFEKISKDDLLKDFQSLFAST
ncbi:MAG: hypothetical protein HeimC3_18640 [Candidatus Heimdallarchaeota archaeon LC_3]|nr:MAG: hypothetical protein HeimC3_18640 [Candidatus Heimdallarchaeota archaeon LC_3]